MNAAIKLIIEEISLLESIITEDYMECNQDWIDEVVELKAALTILNNN